MEPKHGKDSDKGALEETSVRIQEEVPLVSKPETHDQRSGSVPAAKPTQCCNVPAPVLTISTCLLISLFGDSLLYAVLPVVHSELGKWGEGEVGYALLMCIPRKIGSLLLYMR